MALYQFSVPKAKATIDAGTIQDYLTSQDVIVNWVSTSDEGQAVRYTIDAESDPRPLLATFTRPVGADDRARQAIKRIAPKLVAGTGSAAEVQEALMAVIVLMRERE